MSKAIQMNKRNTESLKNKICSEIYGISATSQYKEGKRDGLNKALSIIEGWEKENSVIDGIISESEANGVCSYPDCKCRDVLQSTKPLARIKCLGIK